MNPMREIPIAHVDIRSEDVNAVAQVLQSGKLRQGSLTSAFEDAVASRVGASHAVAVSSGTAALHLTYMALFQPGDEVIVPTFTFVATASMLVAVGATPVFADVDPRTFTLSPDDVEAKLSPRTRGIVGVHLFGNACNIEALEIIARRHDLALVWDAAQALGTTYNNRDIGSRPSVVCYSFYPTKNITTGEGGMIMTDDADLAERLRLLRSQGAARKYEHVTLGFNYRLTDFQSALGIEQLKRLERYVQRRRENAQALSRRLESIAGVSVPYVPEYSGHSFNQYCILIDEHTLGLTRNEVSERLNKRGVETAVHYPRSVHSQPMFGSEIDFPASNSLSAQILALPVHPGLSVVETDVIADAIEAVAKQCHVVP